MSKEAVAKLENEYKENIWKGSKSMIAYACHKISDCYETEKGYLIDTCLNAQDQYTALIGYYLKNYYLIFLN